MRELDAILQAWRGTNARLNDAILATVVHVKGSAYRRPGARMLILSDGRRIGTISGGCLESSVAQKAAWWTSSSGTAIRNFDTSREDAAWEFGLGCNGVISVLLERCDQPGVVRMLEYLDELRSDRKTGVIATVVRTTDEEQFAIGSRLLVDETVIRGGELAGSDLEAEIIAAAEEARMEQRSRLIHLESADIFVEWVAPPPDVFLFGAGHDVIPVNEMAQILGWRVTIAENRPGYARPERFPGAERVIALGPDSDIGGLGIHSEAAVVVMTHNFPLDRIIVPQILDRRPKYLGLLGPKTRAEQLFREMGRPLPDWDIHAPVGLDLGGEGPQSIAIAIVAEIQSVLHGRSAGPLRLRNTPIHKPALVVGSKPQTGYGLRAGSEAVVCETRLAPQHA